MITDYFYNLTGSASGGLQYFAQTGGYTVDYTDQLAAGRGALGDGEDLYGVFHIAAPPSGIVTSIQCEIRGSDTVSGGALSGTIISHGTSRAYTAAELGYAPVAVTGDATPDTFTSATAHGLLVGDAVYLTASGTYPTITGFADFSLPLFVIAASYSSTVVKLSATPGGTSIDMTLTQSGLGLRRATTTVGPGTAPGVSTGIEISVCLNPDSLSRGTRYLQGFVTIAGGQATHTKLPMTCVLALNPGDNQRYRVYPTSIVAS
jgi:hypothetical protein